MKMIRFIVLGMLAASVLAQTARAEESAYVVITGSCRGANWNQGGWPKGQGLQTAAQCAAACTKTAGCTSFDLARAEASDKFDCYLFAHRDVVGEGNKDTCFSKAPKIASKPTFQPLSGSCRGKDWKTKDWPKHLDAKDLNEAIAACVAMPSCTAVDVARLKDGKFDAYAFGHAAVAGDNSPDACFVLKGSR